MDKKTSFFFVLINILVGRVKVFFINLWQNFMELYAVCRF